jgi:hypothetical protein
MKRLKAFAAGLLLAWSLTPAVAQGPPFPQTLPANTVVCRLSIVAGPAEACSFTALLAAMGVTPYVDDFIGGTNFTAGSTTSLTLSHTPASAQFLQLSFDGVVQSHNTFSLSGTTVTFSAAIPTNVQVVEAQYSGASPVQQAGVLTLNGQSGAVNVTSGNGISVTAAGANIIVGIPSASVTNAMLQNPAVTVNGQTCTLGSSCSAPIGRTLLTSNITLYANASTGSDSNPCTSGSPCLTVQHVRNVAFQTYDLAGQYTVTYNLTGAFTAPVNAYGSLVGQLSPSQEVFAFQSGATLIVSGSTDFQAVYGAQLTITSVAGNLTFEAPSSGVCFNAASGGFIVLPAMSLIGCNGTAIQTSWGGTIIAGGNLAIAGNAAEFIFASGGVIQLDPGLTHTLSSTPAYSVAFAYVYAGGILGINGQTWSGSATGVRYKIDGCGFLNTGSGGASYLPGGTSGTVGSCGEYE